MNKGIDINKLTQGSNRSVWWVCCTCGFQWKSQICNRATGCRSGCPSCSRIFKVERSESLGHCYPEIASELYEDIDPYTIAKSSQKKLEWKCSQCGFVWLATVANRTYSHSGCPPCGKKKQIQSWSKPRPGKSLLDLHPKIATMIVPDSAIDNGLTADCVRPKTKQKFHWKCSTCSHEWIGSPSAIINSSANGCIKCGVQSRGILRAQPKAGGSLQDRYPELAAQLISSKEPYLEASQLKYGSSKVVWWRCEDCGCEWQANPARRISGVGCPAYGGPGFTLSKLRNVILKEITLSEHIPSEICQFIYMHHHLYMSKSVSRKIVESVMCVDIALSTLHSWCNGDISPEVEKIIQQYSPSDYGLRRNVRKLVRESVLRRDGYRCLCCESTDKLCIDHIMPFSLGGSDEVENLQVLCQRCNATKGGKVLSLDELKTLIDKKSD